jgi:hypothetical protein
MGVSSRIKRYVPRIVVLVLVVSIALNVYDYFVVLPQIESTVNNMRVEAFKAWRGKMVLVNHLLKRAETNFDIEDVVVETSRAKLFADIYTFDIHISKHPEKLYYWVSMVTYHLALSLHEIFIGNETGVITEKPLNEDVLSMIQNVTTTMENLESKTGRVSLNGVGPAQQLREAGVLTDVLNYLEQIYEVSGDMYNYYRSWIYP